MIKNMVSAFQAAAIEVAEGIFENVKAFASVLGHHPAFNFIMGNKKPLAFTMIQSNNLHAPALARHFEHAGLVPA